MYDEIISHIGSREPTAMRRDSGVIDDSSYPEAGKSISLDLVQYVRHIRTVHAVRDDPGR